MLENPILLFSILPYSAVVTEVLMQAKFCHSLFCFQILSNHGCRTKDKLCYPDNFRKILHIVHPRGAQLVSDIVPCRKRNNLGGIYYGGGKWFRGCFMVRSRFEWYQKMERMIGSADQSQVWLKTDNMCITTGCKESSIIFVTKDDAISWLELEPRETLLACLYHRWKQEKMVIILSWLKN